VAGTTFHEAYTVESFPKTVSLTDFILNQLNVRMESPGRYRLVLRLRDLRSGHAASSEYAFDIPGQTTTWSCSRIEFARQIEAAHDTSQFHKSGLLVVPSVTRSYGGESQLEGPVYLEVYGPSDSQGAPLRLELSATDALGDRKFNITVPVKSAGRVTAVTAEMPVASLTPGRYTVHLRLLPDDESSAVYVDEDWFEILWSMSTLLRVDFPTAVEQLRFISSEAERDSLLAAPDSLRAKAWQVFWDKRDPTPGTPNNEYRDEFYRRVRYCIARFSVGDRPGWRTDRGMIYVRYGEPDEVEQHPFDMDDYPYNAPWQLWRYYATNLEFVFVDRRGSGDFELQYPYDGEYWRRN
jgi:GWxTD domain-containing protein